MNKREKAEAAFLEVFRQAAQNGDPEIFSLDLLEPARYVPVEPSLPHRIGNALLALARRPARPYRPDYFQQLYPVLNKLKADGMTTSRLDYKRRDPDDWPRELHRLADLNGHQLAFELAFLFDEEKDYAGYQGND